MRLPLVLITSAAVGMAAVSMLPAKPPARVSRKPWAFRTPVRPTVPMVQEAAWVRNPLDAFILARREKAGLRGAPPADRRTLLRRLTFDLTGLPPTPAQMDAFLADRAPGAYERQVDRLLASPQYGEHWASFWLDLVRFAETDGFKADDVRPEAWRYRDYVIRSFNADKSFARFVQEQLAGDELFPGDPDAQIATGYNRHYPDEYNAVNLEQRRQEILNDMTDTTSLAFLGLTVGCARCHDHKFDPISQKDYYRFQAFFAAFEPAQVPLESAADLRHYREQFHRWESQTATLREQERTLEAPYRRMFSQQRRARFPSEYQKLLDLPAAQLTPLQRQLVEMVEKQVRGTSADAVARMKPAVRKHWKALQQQLLGFARLKPAAPPQAMALADIGPVAPVTYVLKRGDWQRHGAQVQPGFPSIVDQRAPEIHPRCGQHTTGRRSALAEWLTSPDNPLTARVIVNRLWQHHFGRGIVGTPSDFGAQGEPPTHPELLDWLARELIENHWSLKRIHRLIVTSATYRQASTWNAHDGRLDPDNRLLWHMNRRRLDGEAIRDAMLAVSGELNTQAGGRSVHPLLPAELKVSAHTWPVSPDPRQRNRRSVYIFAKRNLRYPLLSTFDAPDGNESCPRRTVSTTAPQALLLFNSGQVQRHARAFARRVAREAGPDPDRIIDRACRLALGRLPADDERALLRLFLERDERLLAPATTARRLSVSTTPQSSPAVEDLCHALFNLNEFLYVD